MTGERVCVVGAGVIGSLYAGHLAQVAEVSVLTRRAEHAAALERDGLRITGKSDLTARVAAAADPAGAARRRPRSSSRRRRPRSRPRRARLAGRMPGATVMTIQNGLGAEELVRGHGDWPLISAVTFMSGFRHSDAHVEYELDTETWLGPFTASHDVERAQEVEELLRSPRAEGARVPDLRPAQWSKLIFNATVNTVAALTDLPHVAAFAAVDEPADLGHSCAT